MKKVCFFDTKPYDKIFFERYAKQYGVELIYCESKLNEKSVVLARGCDAVVAFVNDTINGEVIRSLQALGIGLVAMRCAGYNNVDLKAAEGKLRVVRVPAYSPYAVAEHAMSIILEDAAGDFSGDKTVDEVAGIIQSRMNIFISENQ